MIKIKKQKLPRICQGDIFRNVDLIEYVNEKNGQIEISKISFPYVIVLTQDCELQQDYNYRKDLIEKQFQNKMLLSVLVAPLYVAEHVFNGEHLVDIIGKKIDAISKRHTSGENIMKNETPRYHYLEFPADVSIATSIIDFKHYFSVNVEYLRKLKRDNFVCKVSELYREDVSLRFANYLSRIGLP